MAAMRADALGRFEIAMEDHLLAIAALLPEVVRHFLLAHQGTDLRPDEIGEPVHRFRPTYSAAFAPRAPRTAAASALTRSCAARAVVAASVAGLPSAPKVAAIASTTAVPTTTASATLAISAASAGVPMPQ